MDTSYWHRQTKDQPLFPDLLWSRPENKASAGKLLIIGGNAHGFAAPAEAYQYTVKAGIGSAKVLLPDALQKTVGKHFEAGEFGPSTPSGSFSKLALAEFLDYAAWADGVLLAGELGRNSETAVALEEFTKKYSGQLTITRDAVDYFKELSKGLFDRPQTTIVLSLAQLQKLVSGLNWPKAVTFGIDLVNLVSILHELTEKYPANIIVKHLDNIFVAVGGQVSTTKLDKEMPIWRVKTAAKASVWWLQNSGQSFEALTTSVNVVD